MITRATKGSIPWVALTVRSCIADLELDGAELQALSRLLKIELKGDENVFELAVRLRKRTN
jgi:hypothetical protein